MGRDDIGGLSDRWVELEDAIVCPPGPDKSTGVLAADGGFCAFSRGYQGPRRAAPDPAPPPPEACGRLAGRHLFAGWLRPHFGHFLLESTARLWALDELGEAIDSVVFTPFHAGGLRPARDRYTPFLDILTGAKPLTIVKRPVVVERLVVPDPGFGHGNRILGSPRYRAHTRARVAAAVAPEGGERLYVTRSGLMDKRGGIFGETRIEALMAANGYEIFHPQRHPIPEQLARYAAARELVALDGSALHMAAYALRPGARIGMILRRRAGLLEGLVRQVELFAGAEVVQLDALRASWVDAGAKRVDFRSIGELDFPRLAQALAETGFVAAGGAIDDLDTAGIEGLIGESERGPMRRIPVADA